MFRFIKKFKKAEKSTELLITITQCKSIYTELCDRPDHIPESELATLLDTTAALVRQAIDTLKRTEGFYIHVSQTEDDDEPSYHFGLGYTPKPNDPATTPLIKRKKP